MDGGKARVLILGLSESACGSLCGLGGPLHVLFPPSFTFLQEMGHALSPVTYFAQGMAQGNSFQAYRAGVLTGSGCGVSAALLLLRWDGSLGGGVGGSGGSWGSRHLSSPQEKKVAGGTALGRYHSLWK